MRNRNKGLALVALVLLGVIGAFALVEPYPQPQTYFLFADHRTLLGISNFWNVASNVLFLVPGIAGLWILGPGGHRGTLAELDPAYHLFFAGVLLTAFGSAWFHLAPDNNSLFWDRLPMTIAFMALAAIIVGEHVSIVLGRRLLWPLLTLGAISVLYWDFSESRDAGDLRLYGLVQFLPLLVIPVILLGYRSVFDRTRFIWILFILYALAKLCELLDAAIYSLGQMISGHTLKHIVASLGPLLMLHGIMQRRRLPAASSERHAE
ncbi:MAG: hypothetical protein R3192_02430 [Woeseiaceae bacterium]|nr:hypothetical protein [Woeseiaceae bacterium]